jgi:hypothetical protein
MVRSSRIGQAGQGSTAKWGDLSTPRKAKPGHKIKTGPGARLGTTRAVVQAMVEETNEALYLLRSRCLTLRRVRFGPVRV